MTAHAKFSPSSAHRWMECPASMAMEKGFPNGSSEYADEGTAAHTLLAMCLESGEDAEAHEGEQIVVEQKDDDGKVTSVRTFEVNDDMMAAVQTCLDSVRRRLGTNVLLVEQKVSFSQSIGVVDQFGTADIIMVSADGEHVFVEDYKHGMGEQVFAEHNHQMLSYAVGVLETFGGVLGDFKYFQLRVHQPRINHEDVWECTLEDVLEHAKRMSTAQVNCAVALECRAFDAVIDESLFAPGGKTCRWCKAKAICPAVSKKIAKEVFDGFEDLTSMDKVVTAAPPSVPTIPERLSAAFAAVDFVEDWCRSVRSEVERRVVMGEEIEGTDGLPMKLVEGRKGHRAWTNGDIAEARLVGILPPEKAYKPREIITPSAADKILNKKKTKAQWEQFQDIIKQPDGKPTVVLGSDPRPPYTPAASAEEFEDLEDPTK